jgi:hypothetical protein
VNAARPDRALYVHDQFGIEGVHSHATVWIGPNGEQSMRDRQGSLLSTALGGVRALSHET